MYSKIHFGKAVALCASALLFVACGGPQRVANSTETSSGASSVRLNSNSHVDATDLGGDIRKPVSPCPKGDKQLYRYAARTLGGNARIDEFCVGENLEEWFVHQPPEGMLGKCPTAVCGMATVSRRGPIESALLQSIVSLEHGRALKTADMTRIREDSTHEFHQVSVQAGSVKFRLDQGTTCVAKLEVFQERVEVDASVPGSQPTSNDQERQEQLRYVYAEGPTVSSGSIYVDQTNTEGTHRLLALIKSRYEGRQDSELFQQKILCTNSTGPIAVSKSPVYGFRVKRVSRDEWMVYAFLMPSPKSR